MQFPKVPKFNFIKPEDPVPDEDIRDDENAEMKQLWDRLYILRGYLRPDESIQDHRVRLKLAYYGAKIPLVFLTPEEIEVCRILDSLYQTRK